MEVQFWLSTVVNVAIFVVFFAWIIYLFVNFDFKPDQFSSYLKLIPGVLLPLMARQIHKTAQRVEKAHEKLHADKQQEDAASIAQSIEDEKLRSIAKSVMALSRAGIPPSSIDLPRLMKSLPEAKRTGAEIESPPKLTDSTGRILED